jgi:hypothetical protein
LYLVGPDISSFTNKNEASKEFWPQLANSEIAELGRNGRVCCIISTDLPYIRISSTVHDGDR